MNPFVLRAALDPVLASEVVLWRRQGRRHAAHQCDELDDEEVEVDVRQGDDLLLGRGHRAGRVTTEYLGTQVIVSMISDSGWLIIGFEYEYFVIHLFFWHSVVTLRDRTSRTQRQTTAHTRARDHYRQTPRTESDAIISVTESTK